MRRAAPSAREILAIAAAWRKGRVGLAFVKLALAREVLVTEAGAIFMVEKSKKVAKTKETSKVKNVFISHGSEIMR